ncbi:hypothetical protein AMTRI_Chr08g210040 [Amborella trichopoda]
MHIGFDLFLFLLVKFLSIMNSVRLHDYSFGIKFGLWFTGLNQTKSSFLLILGFSGLK